MKKETCEDILQGAFTLTVIIGIFLLVFYLYPHISDTPEETQVGYLKGFSEYPFELWFNNDTWYVSDWWNVGNSDPGNMTVYFGHMVRIHYYSGSGRCLVTKIDLL